MTMIKSLFVTLLLTLSLQAQSQDGLDVVFAKYQTSDAAEYTLASNQKLTFIDKASRNYRGAFNYALNSAKDANGKVKANYASKYLLLSVGCGTACQIVGVIDLTTFTAKLATDLVTSSSLEYRANSSLLIIDIEGLLPTMSDMISGDAPVASAWSVDANSTFTEVSINSLSN